MVIIIASQRLRLTINDPTSTAHIIIIDQQCDITRHTEHSLSSVTSTAHIIITDQRCDIAGHTDHFVIQCEIDSSYHHHHHHHRSTVRHRRLHRTFVVQCDTASSHYRHQSTVRHRKSHQTFVIQCDTDSPHYRHQFNGVTSQVTPNIRYPV